MFLSECWSMDFLSDQLFNSKRCGALTILDLFSRECLDIYADKAIMRETVTEVLDRLKSVRGLPKRIEVDNGPEFISKALDAWAYFNHVALDNSRPSTPTDNAHMESYNGCFRDDCLNTNWFMSLDDAREKINRWKNDYNEFRPHSALTYLTPAEFTRQPKDQAV